MFLAKYIGCLHVVLDVEWSLNETHVPKAVEIFNLHLDSGQYGPEDIRILEMKELQPFIQKAIDSGIFFEKNRLNFKILFFKRESCDCCRRF